MNKYILITLVIIIALFFGTNIVSAISTSFADQIRNLPIGDQLTLFAQKVDELEQKTKDLEQTIATTQTQFQEVTAKNATAEAQIATLNTNIQKQISCQQLIRQTPDRGDGQYIGINIIKFYESANKRLAQFRLEQNQGEIVFWEQVLNEAQPFYNKYREECE